MATPDETKAKPDIEFYGGYQVYSESGVDLTLLRRNLERTVEEQWENNRPALEFGNALRETNAARLGLTSVKLGGPAVDTERIVRQLLAHRVEFVVVGGMAMLTHGSAYVIDALEVCYLRTPAGLTALAAALAPLNPHHRGAPPDHRFGLDVPILQAGLNFALTTDLGDLDLLGEVSGIGDYNAVAAQSRERTVFDFQARILSLDGLIAAKKATGRNQDYLHLLELEELKKLREGGPG